MNSTLLIIGLIAAALLVGLLWLSRLCLAVNRTDWGSPWLNGLDGLNLLFCTRYHRLSLVDLPLPEQGPAVVVANHVSGLDPLLMIACSRRPLHFLIAREQYQRFGLQWLFRAAGCIPVDRERSPEKALRKAFGALREDKVVAVFPHGKIHLDSDPPRRTKAGASRLAQITQSLVVPVRISGISREGHVIASVFFRAKAKVECLPLIEVKEKTATALYEEIDEAVNRMVD
ncbi:MAG: 1-acyl-sn-glycerol-3-phosphate acyltransferase [Candidatus Thiodiazotropha sp. (ex Monitilora ramsayi)]|nr:1-acyl-sn-glycerol-3-phosphate acyltransferase [Candidatus Thiodiazotropha sp. (ex Monitilora ramsayi)]